MPATVAGFVPGLERVSFMQEVVEKLLFLILLETMPKHD